VTPPIFLAVSFGNRSVTDSRSFSESRRSRLPSKKPKKSSRGRQLEGTESRLNEYNPRCYAQTYQAQESTRATNSDHARIIGENQQITFRNRGVTTRQQRRLCLMGSIRCTVRYC